MRPLGATLLLAGLTPAQPFEIRGTVTEPGVGGIPGIVIRVARVTEQDGGIRRPLLLEFPVTVTTDARGDFRITLDRPGAYSLHTVLSKAYYPVSFDGMVEGSIQLNAATPRKEVRMTFVRTGQVTGLVLDEETRQPVPDYPVVLYYHGIHERRTVAFPRFREEPATTNRDGRFMLTEIRPDDYVIGTRLAGRYQGADEPDPDPEAVDQGYAETFWPGDASTVAAARPVRLASGGIVDVGTILLRKVPLYKIHVTIPQGECPEGESVQVMVLQSGSPEPIRPPNVIRCGGEGVLRGLDPGSYTLYAVSDWQGEREGIEKAVWAQEPITIADKNQNAKLILQRGVVLEGRFTGPEGVALPKRPSIASRPAELISGTRPPFDQFFEWTSDTTFRMTVQRGPQELSLPGSRGSVHVKEVRYNGAPVRNDIIPVNSGAGAQTLEIVMDDKPAQLSGTVIYGTAAPGRTVAVLQRLAGALLSAPSLVPVSGNGQFRFPVVRPGEYHIFAISPDDFAFLEAPGVLERLKISNEKITVEPGVSQTVTVRLTNIVR